MITELFKFIKRHKFKINHKAPHIQQKYVIFKNKSSFLEKVLNNCIFINIGEIKLPKKKVKKVDIILNVKIVVRIFTKQKLNIIVQNITFVVINVKKNFNIKKYLNQENVLFVEILLK